jgi:hypothetical protein
MDLSPSCTPNSLTVNKLLAFYGTRMFVVVVKDLATGPYPEPNEFSLHF